MNGSWIEPVEMAGEHARLVPLAAEHEAALCDAVRDGELWKLWYTAVPSPEGMRAEIERRLKLQDQGLMLPFTVTDAASRVVGMTTYMNVDGANRRVEIGSTWYARRVQRCFQFNPSGSAESQPCSPWMRTGTPASIAGNDASSAAMLRV